MFLKVGKCPECEQLRRENVYLRKLVDNLLASRGIKPVENPADITPDDPEEIRRQEIEKRGGKIYGEG